MTSSKFLYRIFPALLSLSLLAGCGTPLFAKPTPTPTITPLPSSTPLPTATPTATPEPYYIPANVWSGNLQAPILIYHRFGNDDHENTSMWVNQSTFKKQLQELYDAGFSLVSLSSWLDGTFSVPEGRKPLILTIDDGWSADQIYINADGTPADYSGIGMLWQFAKDHPDFGFAVSINVIMGDKQYADLRIGDWNYVSESDAWKTKLSETIVWAIENGVEVFNHTYTHVDLSATDPAGIKYQVQKNDEAMRGFLALVNRTDLDEKLGNVIAAPQGILPSTQAGMDVLIKYKNPEGKPVAAILAAYNANEALLTPSVYSAGFDRWNLPRTTATEYSIDWVISMKDEIPSMGKCQLGPTQESAASDAAALQTLITTAVTSQTCPEGVYQVNGFIFIARDGSVSQKE
jgi:peptidoglycan/xylan/chitin deacetylase (PgdA/CDA1 family)